VSADEGRAKWFATDAADEVWNAICKEDAAEEMDDVDKYWHGYPLAQIAVVIAR
jgi:hypothetical protein